MMHLKTDKISIPALGLNLGPIDEKNIESVVRSSLEIGYRNFELPLNSDKQRLVNNSIGGSDIPREKLFFSQTIREDNINFQSLTQAVNENLENLSSDYIDLLFIPYTRPKSNLSEILQAANQLNRQGKIKNVGIKTSKAKNIRKALKSSKKSVQAIKLDYSPLNQSENILNFCKRNEILIQSSKPFAKGNVVKENKIKQIADNHNKKPGQIILRWLIQQNISILLSVARKSELYENQEVFDFSLEKEEMEKISSVRKSFFHNITDKISFRK